MHQTDIVIVSSTRYATRWPLFLIRLCHMWSLCCPVGKRPMEAITIAGELAGQNLVSALTASSDVSCSRCPTASNSKDTQCGAHGSSAHGSVQLPSSETPHPQCGGWIYPALRIMSQRMEGKPSQCKHAEWARWFSSNTMRGGASICTQDAHGWDSFKQILDSALKQIYLKAQYSKNSQNLQE